MDVLSLGKQILVGLTAPFTLIGGLLAAPLNLLPGGSSLSKDIFKTTFDNLNYAFSGKYNGVFNVNNPGDGEVGSATLNLFDTDNRNNGTAAKILEDLAHKTPPLFYPQYSEMATPNINTYDDIIKEYKTPLPLVNKK